MLKRIVLKNVASYKEKPISIEFEKKISLFYGLNGAGKSTISNFLSSTSEATYSDCSLTKDADDSIHVYNQKYVNENFVIQDGLPGIFTLSKDNGDILKDIKAKENRRNEIKKMLEMKNGEKETLNNELSQKKQKLLNSVWKIKESYSGGDRVLEFCLKGKMGSKNDLFDYLLSFSSPGQCDYTIDELKKEASEVLGDAQKLSLLEKIEMSDFSSEQELLLKKQIVGNKNSSVSGLIEKLKNEDWVRQGLEFVNKEALTGKTAEKCPFCQENTITRSLIDSITGYFDEAYERDILSLKDLLACAQSLIFSLPEEMTLTGHKKIELRKEEMLLRYRELKTLLEENVRKIESKIKSPGNLVTLSSTKEKLTEVNDIVDSVNRLVDEHNAKIDKADEVSKDIKHKFWVLMRFTYSAEISSFEEEKKKVQGKILNIDAESKGLHSESSALGEEIVQLQKKTVNIDEAIASISNHLKDMGITHFELEKHGDTNTYKIQREGKNANIYQSLSEGEKTIITFLYFLEQCKGRSNPTDTPTKKIIVIDDPVSSLSHMFVFNISRLIKSELFDSKNYEQVIVFTHSLYFFHELIKPKRRDQDDTNQELFRVYKTANGSQISKMNSSEIQNEYQSYWAVIKEESTPSVLLANCMRNILEHFFGFVQAHESINNIFQQPALKENKFQAFLRYMDRGSHSNITNISDYKEINHEYFKDAFRLVFETNGHGDHYKKMMEL